MSDRIRVLSIEDHRLLASGLRLLLSGEPDIQFLGTVETAEGGVERVESGDVDVVLMDLDLPGMDGIEATRVLREKHPAMRVVIVTAFGESELVAKCIEAGANGFVPKTYAPEQLVTVIKRAAKGELVVPAGDLAGPVAQLGEARQQQGATERLQGRLTAREIEVLRAMAEGASTRRIAERLGIRPITVRSHIKWLLSKLGAHSRLEAVSIALALNLVEKPTLDATGSVEPPKGPATAEPGRSRSKPAF